MAKTDTDTDKDYKKYLFISFLGLILLSQFFVSAGIFHQNAKNSNSVLASSCSQSECSYVGQKKCVDDAHYQICGNFDYDACLEWSSSYSCPENKICSDGKCVSVCSNECSYVGQKECSTTGHYKVCGNYDSDSCLEWSSDYSCPEGQTCSDGNCFSNCTDECSYSGQKQCSDSGHYQVCGNYDSDSCLEWSSDYSCPSGQACSNGNCLEQCESQANKQCYDNDVYWYNSCGEKETKYQECGSDGWTNDYKCSGDILQRKWLDKGCSSSACFSNNQWKDYENCATEGKICQNNQCVNPSPICTDDCSYSGQKQCSDSGHYQVCGNYDSDSCLEWSSDYSCPSGQACSNGNCFSDCTDECSYSGQKECSGNGYRTCGNYDSDSCLEWSGVSSCSGDTSCGYGNCLNNQRPNWFCSAGQCDYTCSYDSSCDSGTNYYACYNNDLYWFNFLGQRQSKYQECGADYCNSWGTKYCRNGDVYQERTCYHKGCSGNSCYTNSYTQSALVQDCQPGQICSNGQCLNPPNNCQCSSGPCCDGCHYKSNNSICYTQTDYDYGCPWGTTCGSNVGKQTKARYRYCSGNSSQCDGTWGKWNYIGGWLIADVCSSNETCSAGNSTCQYKSSCSIVPPAPPIRYRRACYDNDIYLYDLDGNRIRKYKDSSDNNSCTIDTCQNGKISNTLKCDGSTCAVGSADYCKSCEHCGDKTCNCGETPCSCSKDCKTNPLSISISERKEDKPYGWGKHLILKSGEDIDFLVTLTNVGEEDLNKVDFRLKMPAEISYEGNIYINGEKRKGSPVEGIEINNLTAGKTALLTFKARANRNIDIKTNPSATVIAEAESEDLFSSDRADIAFQQGNRGLAFIGANWTATFWNIFLLILILLALFYVIYSIVDKLWKKPRIRQKALRFKKK